MRLLARREDGQRTVTVYESEADGSRLYYDNGALYTHIDADGTSRLDYARLMGRLLTGAARVLLLGVAGGAIATELCRQGAEVTAVDNWPGAFEIARRWFFLPPAVDCVAADALDFLRRETRQWDAIAVDLYQGVEVPEALLALEVGALLARRLAPGGLIVWNLADTADGPSVQKASQALTAAGQTPTLVPVLEGGVGNTLVVCRKPLSPTG